jgi:hypothetical protein
MMERDEIVRWAVGELGPASQANIETVLDKIRQEQEDKKSSKPFTERQRNSFCATLRSLRAKLRKLPPKLSSGLGEHQLDLVHCNAWLEICEAYPRPGKPKRDDAWLKWFAAARARELLIQHGKQIDIEGMNRLAAILYGDRNADLRRYCQKTLDMTRVAVDWIYSWSMPVRLKTGLGPQHQQASTLGATPITKPGQK